MIPTPVMCYTCLKFRSCSDEARYYNQPCSDWVKHDLDGMRKSDKAGIKVGLLRELKRCKYRKVGSYVVKQEEV